MQAACFWKEVPGSHKPGCFVCTLDCCGSGIVCLPNDGLFLLSQRILFYSIYHLPGSSRGQVNASISSPGAAGQSEYNSFDSIGFTDGNVYRDSYQGNESAEWVFSMNVLSPSGPVYSMVWCSVQISPTATTTYDLPQRFRKRSRSYREMQLMPQDQASSEVLFLISISWANTCSSC